VSFVAFLDIYDCEGEDEASSLSLPELQMIGSYLTYEMSALEIKSRESCGLQWTYSYVVTKGLQSKVQFNPETLIFTFRQ
jgi:hypothetical protein